MNKFIEWHKQLIEDGRKQFGLSKYSVMWISFLKGIVLTLIFFAVFQAKAEILNIDKGIYQVMYDTKLEQPLLVSYKVTNRPKNADRKGMNFKKEPGIHTSDDKDYVNNVWDKGHMAPAAHFSDSKENLLTTFSYLNSALQHEKLNRGAWRFLEAEVRKLSEGADIEVKNIIMFSENSEKLPTGATVPDGFQKILYFPSTGWKKCYFFTNEAPDMKWQEAEYECE